MAVPCKGTGEFEDWETKVIQNFRPGGEHAILGELDDGTEVYYIPAFVDPFIFVQSHFYKLPPLPDVEPLDSEDIKTPAFSDGTRDEEDYEDAEELPSPAPRPISTSLCVPKKIPPPMRIAVIKDDLGYIRSEFREYCGIPRDMSHPDNRDLRESCKVRRVPPTSDFMPLRDCPRLTKERFVVPPPQDSTPFRICPATSTVLVQRRNDATV